MAANEDSTSTLEDRKTTLTKLAPRAGITQAELASALEIIEERISRLEEQAEDAEEPTFSGATNEETDLFDDRALMNLFAPLLDH